VHPFEYIRVTDVRQAVATAAAGPAAAFLAGGTTQVDLMKDGVLGPQVLIDITRLPLRGVTAGGGVLRVGALTTMEELAADPVVTQRLPVVRESLLLAASPQLRNMATVGGEPAAADPLPLLPGPELRVQQAGAGIRLRRAGRAAPHARGLGHQRALHRDPCLGPGGSAGGARRGRARPRRGR
jgi:CO/xanthine dehydrogenase FAD-binding subunit